MTGEDIEPRLHIWVEGGGNSVAEQDSKIPQEFSLNANFPNPFNPTTTISYSLHKAAPTRLMIYNAMGQVIRIMNDIPAEPGTHAVQWDGLTDRGSAAPTGIYFYKLESGEQQDMKKMILMQ